MDKNSLGLDSLFRADEQQQVERSRAKARSSVADIDGILSQEGAEHLKPIVQAIYGQESGSGANQATSIDGARGGMQVIPATFQRYAKPGERIDNDVDNLRVGVRIIKDLATKFGNDPARIATGYFSGEGNVNAGQGSAWKRDARDGNGKSVSGYVADVIKRVGGQPEKQSELPDLDKAPTWAQVTQNPEYASLTAAEKAEAKAAYFDYWIAPHTGSERDKMRSQFLAQKDTTAPNADAGMFSDAGNLLGIGVNSMTQNVRELVGRVPFVGESIVKGVDAADKYLTGRTSEEILKGNVKDAQARLSPEMQAAGQKKWWDSEKGTFGDAWKDPLSYASGVLQSLPEQFVTMFPAVRLAKGIYASKIAAGVAPEVAAVAAAGAAKIVGRVSEGALGGAASSREVRDKIMAMTPEQLQGSEAMQALMSQGMSFDAARQQIANDSATQAFIASGLVTGAFGGYGDQILAKAFTSGLGKNILTRVGKGVVGEGLLEEFPQEFGSAVAENAALRRADGSVGLTDDALNRAFGGAATGGLQGGVMTAFGRSEAPAAKPAVTPDGRLEPGAQATPAEPAPLDVHPTVQTADAIVRELAQQAGIPESTVLPTPAPVETAGPQAVSDQDVLDFAGVRLEQLRAKRDGMMETVMGQDGPVDQTVPGSGLSPAEVQELATLEQAQGNPQALRTLYGFDRVGVQSDQSQFATQAQVPAPEAAPVEQPTAWQQFPATTDPGLVAAQENQNVEKQTQAVGPAPSPDSVGADGQPSGTATVQEPAGQAPAAQRNPGAGQRYPGVSAQAPVTFYLSGWSDDDLRTQLRNAQDGKVRKAIAAELAKRKAATPTTPKTETEANQRKKEQQQNGPQATETQQAEAQGSEEQQSSRPVTWETIKPGDVVTLYRGENKENDSGGQWWTTKKEKAARYGNVTEVQLTAEQIGAHAVRGHNGADEFVFPTKSKRPPQLAKEKATPAAGAVEPEKPTQAAAKLPKNLEKSKPRYAFGPNQYTLSFESDVDKAAYITAGKEKSKRDADFIRFVAEATGLSDEAVIAHGNAVKEAIKGIVKPLQGTEHDKAISVPNQAVWGEVVPQKRDDAPTVEEVKAKGKLETVLYEGKSGFVRDEELFQRSNLDIDKRPISANTLELLGQEYANMFAAADAKEARESFDENGKFIGKHKYRAVISKYRGGVYMFNDLAEAKAFVDSYGQRTTPKQEPRKRIGKGERGQTIFENEQGIRSYRESGFRYEEEPGKPRKDEFKTVEELSAEQTTKPDDPDAERKAKAKADLDAALGDLGDLLGKGTRLNITPEEEQKLLPILTRVMDAAFRMGYYKFKDTARFVLDTIRERLGKDVSDQITLDHLQGAYIGMAGKYQSEGASTKREVISVESLNELAGTSGVIEETPGQAQNAVEETLNDTNRNQSEGAGDQGQGGDLQPRPAQADSESVANPAPEDVRQAEGGRDGGGSGTGAASGDVERGESVREGGDAANRRPRNGRKRVANDGAGERAGADQSGAVAPAPESQRANYFISDPEPLVGGTPKVRFARNKKAIEAFQSITSEAREPTPDELGAMAGYIGWGSFGQELFQGTYDRPRPKDGWQAESDWLREHLGREGWNSAQASIINAHYTDPITVGAMWDMVRQLGFTGGRVLEPSMGVGNFFGLMPRDLMAKSRLAGIEMEQTTGGMAKILYPEANIQIKPYQDSKTADNFYDLVIGNWPFAKDGPADRRYMRLSPSLHDYFFLKALDQTRAGGLVVGITSAGTMDKKGTLTRAALAEKADLVAAFRLPSGAFEKYAGTAVVTDIIILKKRETPNTDPRSSGWLQTAEVDTPSGQPITVNEYFAKNPDKVLGRLNFGSGTTYGRPAMIVERPADLEQRLTELPATLPAGTFEPATTKAKTIQYVTNNTSDRQQSITVQGGKLFQVQGEYLAPLADVTSYKLKDAKKTAEREAQLADLVEMRRAYGALIDAERDGAEDTEAKRKTLRDQFNAFVNQYGKVSESDGLAILKRVGDPFYPSIAALEMPDGSPSAILSKPTIRAKKKLDKPTVRDALVLARNESIDLDMARVAELAGVSEEAAAKELMASGAVFQAPDGVYEISDVYLSGNVRRKLREAEAAAEQGMDMARNIKALKEVLPKDIPYFNIEAKLGATWIRPEQYAQFIAHLLAVKDTGGIEVRWAVNRWKVRFEDRGLNTRPEATTTWGHAGVKFDRLLTAAMGNVAVKITYKDEDGNLKTDEQASAEANEKAGKIRDEFANWLWSDSVRKIEMERTFNEVMNAIALPKFDGSFLSFEGMTLQRGDSPFNLRKHQIDAIWRGLANGRSINAHEVGTGKTYTMGGLAVESRRYGLAKKPIIFAHNANSASVAREIGEMYPGAKLLYIDNLAPERIAVTLRQIANDDWDAVIVPHSLIDRFTLKRETLVEISREQIESLEQEAIEAALEDNVKIDVSDMNDEKKMKNLRSSTAKQLVHARNAILKKIEEMAMRSSREDAISFEDMGIDMVIVDEAHEFKKPPIATRMRMRGLNTQTSAQSISLMFLTDYVKRLNSGRGVHMFTGTPITNTLTEIYNMMRYVMDDQMARDGIRDWDAWFNTFADSTSDVELTASGEYEPVTRMASFVNVAELRRMIGQYMDIVFADDMPEFKPRETANGKTLTSSDLTETERTELLNGRTEKPIGRPYKKVVADVAEMTPEQAEILALLQSRSNAFKNATKKARREMMLSGSPNSPVIVETDAANAGLDARLFDMSAPDAPTSKVNRAAARIVSHYKEHPLATQVVFVERGFTSESVSRKKDRETGKTLTTKEERFNLVQDLIEKLVAAGVKRDEIAVVDGGVSKEKRKLIADAMNRAEIRVVIGNTKTLGVGVNMQTNLRAMHHLDAPWMPGDLEQRNGRGHRQGNKWNTVLEYRYLTERIDGRRWQVLSVKDRFIKAFLKAKADVRVIEGDAVSMDEEGDIGSTLSEAAGDPRLLLKNKLRADIERLESKERMHAQGVFDATKKAEALERDIESKATQRDKVSADDAAFRQAIKAGFDVTVNGRKFDDAEQANEALARAVSDIKEPRSQPYPLGEAWGFKLSLVWPSRYSGASFVVSSDAVNYAIGKATVESARQTLYGIKDRIAKTEAEIADAKESIPRLQESAKAPFARAADLEKKRKMLADLEADIQANPIPAPAWLRSGAPVNTEVFVGGKPVVVEGHRWTKDGYLVTVSEEGKPARDVDYQQVKDENGLPLYEARPFAAPEVQEATTTPRKFNNLATAPSFAFTVTPEPVRDNALAKLQNLQSKREAGKITEAEYRLGVQQLLGKLDQRTEASNDGRGADWIVAQLRRGVADKTVPRREVDFAEWLLRQNPNLANDLGMALSADNGKGTAGNYDTIDRIVTLFTSSKQNATAVHEILHHTERMMPREVQDGLMKEWKRAWDAAYKAGDDRIKAALNDMLAASLGDDKAHDRTMQAFDNGTLNYTDHYQLYSPSEFWATKATDILVGRYVSKGSWVTRAVQWFKEFVQRAKAAFGLNSDAPILKALEAVMRGDGVFQPGAEMMASRVDGASKADNIQYNDIVRKVQNNAVQFFGNQKDTLKTFGVYHKTLSTQYHKALKDRDFGRVFGFANAMQNHVSIAAIRPAELAPGVLPRVDDVKSALKTVWKGKKASADLDGATKAIFAGTLNGENVMQGKVFSDDELRTQFKLNDTGIALYKQARAAIDASLDELAASEAFSMAQGFVPKAIRRPLIDNPQAAPELLEAELTKQIKVLRAAIKTAAEVGNAEQQAQLEASLQSYLDTRRTVEKIFVTAKNLKLAGYAPLMRFGKYTVTVQLIDPETGNLLRDENGESITEFYGQYETEGEAIAVRNQKEALYKDRDDMRVTAGTKSQSAHELYAGISPETMAVFADAIGANETMKKYYQLALSERSALKRRLERKGISGFNEDMPRVLSNFITSNARFAAQRYYLRDLNNAIKFIPKEKGDVMDEAIALKKFLSDPNDPAAPVSAAMFAWFLGGSVASAVVNLTQPVMMTAPYLSQHGVGRATAAIAKAMPYAMGKKQITDPDLRDALKKASQEGIVDAQEIFHLYSLGAQGVASGLTNALARLPGVGGKIKAGSESARARINAFLTLWGSMFSVAESFNRKLTFLAAWEVAKAKGETNPYAFAVKAVNETQGIYNKVNRPNWARGPVGRTILTFKQFSIAYVELLSRMWKRGGPEGKRAALMMLAMLMLASGEEGLPFSQDLDDLIDTVGQLFGFDTNMKRNKRRLAHEILGKTGGDLFLYGISSQLPLDFAGRLGLGNIIPGSGAFKRSDQELIGRNVAEVLGPAAGMATQIADAYDAYVEGNQKKALQNLAPKAVKDVLAGLEMADKGYATDAKGRKTTDVTQGEAVIKAVGFTPTTVAQLTRKTMPVQQDVALQRRAESSILDEWVRGIADNDQAMIAKAQERMAEWNESNPDSPIVITAQQIQARRRAMSLDKETRLLKAAPKEMRGRVAEGLDTLE